MAHFEQSFFISEHSDQFFPFGTPIPIALIYNLTAKGGHYEKATEEPKRTRNHGVRHHLKLNWDLLSRGRQTIRRGHPRAN